MQYCLLCFKDVDILFVIELSFGAAYRQVQMAFFRDKILN